MDFLAGTTRGDFRTFSFPVLVLPGTFKVFSFCVLFAVVLGDFMAEKLVFILAVDVTFGTNGTPVCGTGVLKSVVLDLSASLFEEVKENRNTEMFK